MSSTGNAIHGNILTAGLISATSTITSAANITGGNITTVGLVTATGNITGGNLSGTLVTGTLTTAAQTNVTSLGTLTSLSVTGNTTGGNFTTSGTISVGGITLSGNLIVGAGPTLTIDPNGSGGTDGNVVITGNLTVNGTTTTINSNTITTNDLQINMANNAANATAANNGGIGVGPAGAEYATLLYNTASNVWVSSLGISSVGNITAGLGITATGNLAGGNILTAGLMSSTGNAIHGNILTAGLISATSTITSAANVVGGNITTAGLVTATGNVTGGNILTAGIMSSTGNAIHGNILTAGLISATSTITSAANINGANITTAGIASIGSGVATGSPNATNILANAYAVLSGNGANYLTFGQYGAGNSYAQWIQSAFSNPTTAVYNIILQPLGGNIGIGTATPGFPLTVAGAASVSGNVTGGNILTAGLMSSTGNAIHGNILTAGLISATGNINSAGNITFSTTNPVIYAPSYVQFNNGIYVQGGTLYVQNGLAIRGIISNDTGAYITIAGGTSGITYFSGNVGIGTNAPAYNLQVVGSFAATTKSFVIDHPTRPDMKLRYGSLEGPENGVYVRGRLTGSNTIQLPEYWTKLVDPDSITVQLTPVSEHQNLYVKAISNNCVTVGGDNINCFYTVYAERCDVAKLVVEIENDND
jgi:hypothetical protein